MMDVQLSFVCSFLAVKIVVWCICYVVVRIFFFFGKGSRALKESLHIYAYIRLLKVLGLVHTFSSDSLNIVYILMMGGFALTIDICEKKKQIDGRRFNY